MKNIKVRLFFMAVAWALFCAIMAACAIAPAPVSAQSAGSVDAPADDLDAAGMDLDTAIKEAAAQMGENLPGGTKVALVSGASSSAQLSEYVISRLEAALVGGKKLVVVDRANLDKIREEQGFQASGEVDDDSAKSIGKLLGAGAIVTGAFADLGDVYSLALKAINIETATVAVSYPGDIAKSTRIETLLASGGGAGTGTRTAQTGGNAVPATRTVASAPAAQTPVVQVSTPASAPTVPPVPTYKIGDTGPAGGLIFYDKGNNSSGWRYLEAAPADIDRKLYAARERITVKVERSMGTGKTNTQAIMREANNRGGGFGWAAQACDALVVNGFDDWFLPSRDELHYMYGNLHIQGLGDFKSEWYWSSTFVDSYTINYWFRENFANGDQQDYPYQDQVNVRACRQF
jgi:hypothetical protein